MDERHTYKSQIQKTILTIAAPVILFVLWQAATTRGWVRGSVLPSPKGVVDAGKFLWERGLFQADVAASLMRILKGFVIGSVIGIMAGILIGIFPKLDQLTKVLIAIFRPVPIIALIPLFILWMGIGEESKVTVITLGTFWSLLLNTIDGIKGVDTKLIELSRMLGKTQFETIRYVILPNALPSIYTGIRLAISAAVGYVITAEMIAASQGIGYRIMYARNMAQPAIMFVGIIEIGLFGLVADLLLLKLQSRIFRYRQ